MRQAHLWDCVQAGALARANRDAQEAARRRQRALVSPEGRRPAQRGQGERPKRALVETRSGAAALTLRPPGASFHR